MEKSNKLFVVSVSAFFMLMFAVTVQFFTLKVSPLAQLRQDDDVKFTIASYSTGPACVSLTDGQKLFDCEGQTCTDVEVFSCLRGIALNEDSLELAQNTRLSPELSQSLVKSTVGEVAGITDVACTTNGGSAGQIGCRSGLGITIEGTPRSFRYDNANPLNLIDTGPFNKSASENVNDASRYFRVGEPIRFAINLKNQSQQVANDNFEFFVLKVTQAPKGTNVNETTALCEAQLGSLNANNDTVQVQTFAKVNQPYSLNPNQTKLVGGEWVPTRRDCGLYQIDLGAMTFDNASTKRCSGPIPQDRVIAAAFVRVSNGSVGCELPTCDTVAVYNANDATRKQPLTQVKPGDKLRVRVNLKKSPRELQLSAGEKVQVELTSAVVGPNAGALIFNGLEQPIVTGVSCATANNVTKCDLANTYTGKFFDVIYNVANQNIATNDTTFSFRALVKYGINDISQSGEVCATSVQVQTGPVQEACVYDRLTDNDWVEQYRAITNTGIRDVNQNARHRVFTIPGTQSKQVTVRYEYRPVRDKTVRENERSTQDSDSSSADVRCAPQSNEEPAFAVVKENSLGSQLFAQHIFTDNKVFDGYVDLINGVSYEVKESTITLSPGVYSITSRWQGDGQDFSDRPRGTTPYKYLIDARNPSLGSVTYEDAIANEKLYGRKCKWTGSYQVRATYCVVNPTTNTQARLQKLEITVKNTNNPRQAFSGMVYVNGIKLVQMGNNRDVFAVTPGATRKFTFVYNNEFPSSSVIEIVERDQSMGTAVLTDVKVKNTNSSGSQDAETVFTAKPNSTIDQKGVRISFPN